tara:strand:+ start:11052 stop:11891 length:840 start_codon:yes stop_codon:yes gene_type:complete
MVLKSYAKINLSLTVNKKLANGLHDIQSIFCLVNLKDTVSIKKFKSSYKDKISFVGPYSKDVNLSNNSIKILLNVMRKYKLISNFFNIKIHKNIPVFSGLGGGSSNATTIFKFLLKKKIKKSVFYKIINQISSDMSLFFFNQGYQNNLNKITKLKKKHKLYFLVVVPNIKCSTKFIYSKVNKYSKKKILNEKNFNNKKKFIEYLMTLNNDLQLVVEKEFPIIRKLLFNISRIQGCYFSRLTGSGSACYGLFRDLNSSKVAAKKLRKKYPKYWLSIAKTI